MMTFQDNLSVMRLQRRFKDLGIEGVAARWYDGNTRKHRIGEMKQYANEVVKHIRDGSSIIEIAAGPGYLSIELAKLGGYKIIGLDISKEFVEIAWRNAKEAGVNVEFRRGTVSQIPFQDNTFDFIICTAAFKNFKDPFKALDEMNRVLRPSGTALIIDMDKNASNQQIQNYIERTGAKGIDKFIMKAIFTHFLRNGAYTKDELISIISRTAFDKYNVKQEGIGFYIYLTK